MVHRFLLAAALVTVLAGLVMIFRPAQAQVLSPPPDQLRFQVLSSEPIAAPDRRSVVAGTSAMVVKDQRTGTCYVVVTVARGASMAQAPC
jgi:hypothetical protein